MRNKRSFRQIVILNCYHYGFYSKNPVRLHHISPYFWTSPIWRERGRMEANKCISTMFKAYSIYHKIGIFPCERDFYFFEIIRLRNYSSNFISLEIIPLGKFRAMHSSQTHRNHTFRNDESLIFLNV